MGGEEKEKEGTRGQEADEEKMEKAEERGGAKKKGHAVEGDKRETGVENAYLHETQRLVIGDINGHRRHLHTCRVLGVSFRKVRLTYLE